MKFDKRDLLLYAVTDRSWLRKKTLYEQVEQALLGGATFIQLREKQLDEAHFMEEAVEIQKLCKQYGVPFLINDNVELAVKMNADGVHVGQEDMEAGEVRRRLGPDKIIGVSAHSVEEALRAEACGADYLGAGAVFNTNSKSDVTRLEHETLKEICDAVKIPVIAIGGISKDNLLELSGTGICGVAVISAIFAQENIKTATRELQSLSKQMTGFSKRLRGLLGIKGAIFDMDGTLLDSMPVWEHASERYLEKRGIKPKEKLSEILFSMSMQQGAAYVKESYGLTETVEEIVKGVNGIVAEFYQTEVLPKPGVRELLKQLRARGIKMAVATSTDRTHVEAALKRTEIYEFFEGIFTCSEVGAGKVKPAVYDAASECLSVKPEETLVFEDALYAIRTAKAAGYGTVGVFDAASEREQDVIQTVADIYVKNVGEFIDEKDSTCDCGK